MLLETPSSELTDLELASRAVSGERAAVEALLRRHVDHVRAVALSVTKNQADADDVIQETFLKVCDQIHTFDRERGAQLATWIHAIARNTALSYAFREKRRKGIEEEHRVRSRSDSENGVEEMAEETRKSVRNALSRLPHDDREVLLLRYWKGLTFEEIRRTLGCALSTAARRHAVALAKVSKILLREKYNQ